MGVKENVELMFSIMEGMQVDWSGDCEGVGKV